MTSKEILIFLVKHGHKLKKEKVDELKNIVLKDLDKLEKIKSIVNEANDKINKTTTTMLIPFWMSKSFHEIKEVLNNEPK